MIINVTWEMNITVKALKDFGFVLGIKILNNVRNLLIAVILTLLNNVLILIALGITSLKNAQILA